MPKEISTQKMSDFVHHVMDDLSASERIRMTYLGNQLGLYKAMAFAGPMTVGELARRAGTNVRLVKHWADSLAVDGHIEHEPETDTFNLPAEHAIALTDPKSPFYIGSRFQSPSGVKPTKRQAEDEHASVFKLYAFLGFKDASARFFSQEYLSNLFDSWLPGVEGLTARLQSGITVADLGCGRHGASTFVMARAFPASTFIGFDRYASSVERANLLAKEKQLHNAHFELATAEQVYAHQYDLITLIECLHHMGEEKRLLQECYEVLKPDGVLVVVEAKDSTQIGEELYQRMRSAKARAMVAEEVIRVELGIDAAEKKLRETALAAGFTSFRKVAVTQYDKVYEIRP